MLYTRKLEILSSSVKWIITIALMVFGIIGLTLTPKLNDDNQMLFWGMCVPFIYYSFDVLFKSLSIKYYNRDFILWLKGSGEIDDSFGGSNLQIKTLDIVFSLGLLVIILFATFFGMGMIQ